MKKRIASFILIVFSMANLLSGCFVPKDRRKRFISFNYRTETCLEFNRKVNGHIQYPNISNFYDFSFGKHFSHNNYLIDYYSASAKSTVIYDLEENVYFKSEFGRVISGDDNYWYATKNIERLKIDYKGNVIQRASMHYALEQIHNGIVYFSNRVLRFGVGFSSVSEDDKVYYFEDNDFEKKLIEATPEQLNELNDNLPKLYFAHAGYAFFLGTDNGCFYMVDTDFDYGDNVARRTKHWANMDVSTVYKIDETAFEHGWFGYPTAMIGAEKTEIYKTDPQSYVLYFDGEKIITYSDNVIYKAYYAGGEKEAIMTVDWDDGGKNTKKQYEIVMGEFGFVCNDVIYSAAYDKIFRPADIPLAVSENV